MQHMTSTYFFLKKQKRKKQKKNKRKTKPNSNLKNEGETLYLI